VVEEPVEERVDAVVEEQAEREPSAAAPGDEEDGRPTQAAVDALFARLKAGRDEHDHPTESDVATEPEAGPAAAPEPDVDVAATPQADETVEADEAKASTTEPSATDALLARRDAAVEPATRALNRHLKRLLADEQNDLLDRLRREGTKAALPAAGEHDGAWAGAASSELALAAAAGAAFLGTGGEVKQPPPDDLVAVAEALADAIARPLRERLGHVLAEADDDADVAGDGVRATYRTWRSERLGPAIDHAVLDAFSLGVTVAFGAGTPVTWLMDDGGNPCPDCDDDALAGALPCGEAFPTGHRRPPAHAGCRCLLVAPDATAGA
jgi:hypothetical protein